MRLVELQRHFRSWLVSASDQSATRLAGNKTAGLAVYQNNYRAQLVGCLEESFPQVRAWMGDEAFHYAAVSHVDKHPPQAWTLDAYADHFGSTLAELFPHNPDIHELAWIETALTTAFITRDTPPLSATDLAATDWDAARLRFTPSLQARRMTTNAGDIWWTMRDCKECPEGEMLEQPRGVIVWRRGYVSCLHAIDLLELDALVQMQSNGSFGALCDMLVDRYGDSEGIVKAGSMLAGWIDSELITGVDNAA
jgi:hypothetical protein